MKRKIFLFYFKFKRDVQTSAGGDAENIFLYNFSTFNLN